MTKKITIVALVALMLLLVSLPANAAITANSVEIRGTVLESTTLGNADSYTWSSENFAGFWYDLKDNLSTESLIIESFKDKRTIDKEKLRYNSKIAPTEFKVSSEKGRLVEYGLNNALSNPTITAKGDRYYDVVGWMAEKFVGINGKNNKLAKLIMEQDVSDKMTLTVGQTWEMGGGYTLTAQSIDARSTPRLAWFVLSKDGAKLDDKVIESADSSKNGTTQGVYTYYATVSGESNVPIFVTYIDSVFSGATSDMVQLKYTWLIENKALEVKSGDMYGIFKVDTENPLSLKSDSSVSLSKDSVVTLAGNMKFRISDSDPEVRFYPMVEYMIGETGAPSTNGTAVATATGTRTTTLTATPTILKPGTTATEAPAAIAQTTQPNATATPKEPGFEAVFAIAGLLAVAFLVLRQRK